MNQLGVLQAAEAYEAISEHLTLGRFALALAVSLAAALAVAWLYRAFCESRGTGSQLWRAFPAEPKRLAVLRPRGNLEPNLLTVGLGNLNGRAERCLIYGDGQLHAHIRTVPLEHRVIDHVRGYYQVATLAAVGAILTLAAKAKLATINRTSGNPYRYGLGLAR